MASPYEEINPRPDVGPQVEPGVIRFKRHATRQIVSKDKTKLITNNNTYFSYVILFIVYVIAIVAIAFSLDRILIDSTSGFMFLILSILAGYFLILWSTNQKHSTFVLTVTLLTMLAFIMWWVVIEFYQFRSFGRFLAIVGAVLIFFLILHYKRFDSPLLVVFITFVIGIFLPDH
jgi:hypothetical protein